MLSRQVKPGEKAIVTGFSCCLEVAAWGIPQRGSVHSAFKAAANLVFPGGLLLSLNAADTARMPNGIQLSTLAGALPFSALRVGMPVLFGARQLQIDAVDCWYDLSHCPRWNPQVNRPTGLDMAIVQKNSAWLTAYIASIHSRNHQEHWSDLHAHARNWRNVLEMARYLCGRGTGLTPAGDDMLIGWIAMQRLLHGAIPPLLAVCQQIMSVARQQTHLLSQCWLGYAAGGNVSQPLLNLLLELTGEDAQALSLAVQVVLAMGASSGYDTLQGVLLALADYQVNASIASS